MFLNFKFGRVPHEKIKIMTRILRCVSVESDRNSSNGGDGAVEGAWTGSA